MSGRPPTAGTPGTRAVEVRDESDTELVATVADGAEAVVSVPWNFNAGWEAELDGRRVEPIRVDGWQQGWVVPEGTGGTLTMRFAPQGTYAAVLVAGLAVSGLLLLAALLLLTRCPGSAHDVAAAGGRWTLAGLARGDRCARTGPGPGARPRGRRHGMGRRGRLRRRRRLAPP